MSLDIKFTETFITVTTKRKTWENILDNNILDLRVRITRHVESGTSTQIINGIADTIAKCIKERRRSLTLFIVRDSGSYLWNVEPG